MESVASVLKDEKGILKWINPRTGYGCIRPEDGRDYVFVELSTLERAGISVLNEGQRVSYDLRTENGVTSAVNLKLIC